MLSNHISTGGIKKQNYHLRAVAGWFFSAFIFSLIFAPHAFGAASTGYSEYYIPGDEDSMSIIFDDIGLYDESGATHVVISVTAWSENSIIYYDHWEDGYDFDPDSPVSTADETVALTNRGDSRVFEESGVPLPRSGANLIKSAGPPVTYYYDGRDRIYVAGGAATVSRASWVEDVGTVESVAWEIYPVRPQLTTYILPFGEDLDVLSSDYQDFERVYCLIQATADNTVIQVDINRDGTYDSLDWDRDGSVDGTSTTLSQGQVFLLDRVSIGNQAIDYPGSLTDATTAGGTDDNLVISGTQIQASSTVQVQYIVGDEDTSYEIRGLSAFPRGFWDDEYYAPADGAANGDTEIYLYNPHNETITITYETQSGSGTFNIPSKTTVAYSDGTGGYVPQNTSVYLSGTDVFWGVSTIDTESTTHDWGYSLVPAFLLENEHFIGWAPGSFPLGNTDDSGVFIAAAQDNITVYVDYDADGFDTADGDVSYNLSRLETQYVFDASDGDMSDANIFATGFYVMAYGQNPDTATAGLPAVDVGYTTIPGNDFIELVFTVDKSVSPQVVPTVTGAQTDWTVKINTYDFNVDAIDVIDTLPPGWQYVDDSTTITWPDGSTDSGNAYDPTISGGGSILTWPDTLLGDLDPNQEITIVFTAETTQAFGIGEISKNEVEAVGTREVESVTQTFSTTDFAFVTYGNYEISKTSDGVDPLSPGDQFEYTVTVTNPEAPVRATEYYLGAGEFTGTTYDLTLDQDLADDYFVIIRGSDGDGSSGRGPDENYAALTGDPNGTGDLDASGSSDVITLTRGNNEDDWIGVVTVVESPTDQGTAGFNLLDVQRVSHASASTGGTDTSGAAWSDIDQVMLMGGFYGPGCDTNEPGNANHNTCWARIYPSGTNTINWTRDDTQGTLGAATSTVMVLEWGDEWTIQRVNVTGSNGGDGLNASGEYNTAAISSVVRENTWVWGVGHTDDNGLIDGAEGAIITLGNGQTQSTNETTVAVGTEDSGTNVDFEVYALTHPTIKVDYEFKADGDGGALTVDVDVENAGSNRMALAYNGCNGGGTAYPRPIFSARYLDSDTIRMERRYDGQDFPAWVQGIEFPGSTITGIAIYDPIPSGTTYVAGSSEVTEPDATTSAANDPPNFVTSGDGYSLAPGETLTLTFEVTVDDPLPTGLDEIVNTVSVTTNEFPVPLTETVTNIVNNPSADTGEVGDLVWLDADGDGVKDTGESGLANVQVTLKDQFGTPVSVTTTDSAGRYRFTGIEPGDDYYAEVTGGLPAGLVQSAPSGHSDNKTDPFDLSAGQVFLNADLGYTNAAGTGSIGDLVWNDVDGDGNRDSGELGLPDVVVRLYTDTDGNGTVDDAVTVIDGLLDLNGGGVDGTDDGTFHFYEVIDGYLDIDGSGTITAADSGNVGGYAVIGGAVDIDGDGTIETGSTDDDGSVAPYDETTTAGDGSYLFSGVPAASDGSKDYIVFVDAAQAELSGYTNTTAITVPVPDLDDGESRLSVDFGFQSATIPTYTYNDRVWFDANEDEEDDGETGISGVTVNLLNSSRGVLATVTTDADGYFTFSGLQGGTFYYVEITDSAGKLTDYFGTTSEALAGEKQVSNLTGNVDYTVEPAEPSFGYSASGAIGDTVFNDVNGDGDQDAGELGLAGITVTLYDDADGDGLLDAGETVTPVATATTDAGGNYIFSGLDDGDYIVSIDSPPAGYDYTTEEPPANPDNYDDDPASGSQQAVTISSGNSFLDIDFGYEAQVQRSVAGTLWDDEDESGTQNGLEGGIVGVTVELYADTDGDGVIDAGETLQGTVTTDSNGNYAFNGLPSGEYIVKITDDSGVLSGYETTYEATEGSGSGSYNGEEAVDLTSGDAGNIDFGYYKEQPPTRAVIGEFGAFDDGGRVVVRWKTVSEHGTVGFYLYRLNDMNGRYKAVNNRLLPGLLHSPAGGSYSYEDRSAKVDTWYTYRLEEAEVSGKRLSYGPWRVYTGTLLSEADASVQLDNHASIAGYRTAEQPLTDETIARLTEKVDARLAAYAAKLARTGGKAKIYVEEDGLYFIDASDISTVLELSREEATRKIKNKGLRLRCMGQDVAALPAPDNSGLYFFGQRHETRFTDTNVYWLDINKGLNMPEVSRPPKKAVEEGQYFYQWVWEETDNYPLTGIFKDPKDDFWMWDYVFPGYGRDQLTFSVSTPGVVEHDTATVTVALQGATDDFDGDDHSAVIRLNDVEIGNAHWDGFDPAVISVSVDASVLNDGENRVDVAGIKLPDVEYNYFYVNHLQIVYPRSYTAVDNQLSLENNGYRTICIDGFTDPDIWVFDITNPRKPRSLDKMEIEPSTGSGDYQVSFNTSRNVRQYLAVTPGTIKPCTLIADQPSFLDKRFNLGEYIIITSSDMMSAARELADYRATWGHVTKVVDIEDIYDDFSYGIPDAESIRTFLAYAYSKWRIPPQYVLLAGDGSFDYKDNKGFGDSIIPALMSYIPDDGLRVTDNAYADVAGDDWVPEFAIGRIPVISEGEFFNYISKVIGYESASGAWTRHAILAADAPDEGGDFVASSEEVAGLFPATFTLDRLYMDTMSTADARDNLINGLNDGRAYVNFVGHGTMYQIGFNKLFSTGPLEQDYMHLLLHNSPLLPVFTAMTCVAGDFGLPGFDAFSETLVVQADDGAIAVWAPSGLAYNDQSMELCKAFYSAIFTGGELILGDAIRWSKENYTGPDGLGPYPLDLYNLMGDPALRLK